MVKIINMDNMVGVLFMTINITFIKKYKALFRLLSPTHPLSRALHPFLMTHQRYEIPPTYTNKKQTIY